MMKICTKCKQEKPLEDYHKDRNASDGHCYFCKACNCKTANQFYQDHKEEYRKQSKQYQKDHEEEIREYKKQFYQDHKEEIREREKQYRQDHKEEIRERKKQYRQDHKEEIREHRKQYHQDHKEELHKKRKEHRRNHLEKYKAIDKKNRQTYRETKKLAVMRRRARKKGAEGDCTKEELKVQVDLYNGMCYIPGCGKPYEAIDHVIPLAKGGTNWPDNLRPICRSCNSSKGAKSLEEFLKYR